MRARLTRRVADASRATLPADTRIVAARRRAAGRGRFVDTLVSTLVLCSVPDLDAAVAELRRVVAPSGRLLLIEHVAGHGRTRRLQRAIDPAWRIVARGCRLVRDTRAALERGGFDTSAVDAWSLPGGGVTGPAVARDRPTALTAADQASPRRCRAAVSVFCSSIVTVIGPTPPGTGVIAPATSATPSKSTSPTRRPSAVRLVPTSITTAPGRTMSAVMSPAGRRRRR
jgi:SAM-dependent methyltransferase